MRKIITSTLCVFMATVAMANEIELPGKGELSRSTQWEELFSTNKFRARWVGPVGIYCTNFKPEDKRLKQLRIEKVDEGSPADGILKKGDMILGADGSDAAKVPLFKTAEFGTMQEIGDAVTEAEARNPAILNLLVWRQGVAKIVPIQLEYLGRYSDTAPYNCEKSRKILRKGIQALYESDAPGRFNLGILCLLAADDPTNPENDKYQAKAKEWAHNMIIDRDLSAGWQSGVELIVLSEYYLKTKDEAVFPEIAKRALNHARGVSWFGTTGHRSADRKPDGSFGGRIAGYGPINCSGTLGFLGLSLARKAGVKNPEVDAAIKRQRIFFGHFAFHGGLGYGEMPYWIMGARGDHNGKHAMTALALGLQEKQEEKAKYFTKLTALSTSQSRIYAHGGPFFGQVWQPIAAAQGGVKSAHLQFQEIRWHLDLKRSWNDSFIYDPTNNKYGGFSYPAHSLLFYALPLKQLYMTGRGQKDALKLSDAEFKELQAIKTFDAGKFETQELIAELSRHDGMTRNAAANELVARIKKDPESAESKALVDQLIALAADRKASKSGRAGAFTTLMYLKNKSGKVNNPQDLKIVKTMVAQLKDPDHFMRFAAIRVMQAFHSNFTKVAIQPYANDFLDAIIATDRPTFPLDEENPVRWDHGEMSAFLFGTVLYHSLEGVDRKKLITAIRSSLRTPNGNNRYYASRILDKLPKEEVLAVADILVDNAKFSPPANSMGGSAVSNTQKVLAKYLFEEALPLSLLYDGPVAIKNKIHQQYGQAAFDMQSTRELMKAFGDLMLAGAVFDANKVIEEMWETPAPDGIAKLKRIDAVKAADSTLTLPAARTELEVDATNYGCRGGDLTNYGGGGKDETTYTWRKVYGAGKVTFTPNASGKSKKTTVTFTDQKPGKYRFVVTMSDTLGYSELSKTVEVTLFDKHGKLPPNRPPVARSQSLETAPGLPLPVTLTGIDPDGDELGFAVTQEPAHGKLSGTGGNLTYTAKFGFNGTDTFTFIAVDGQDKTAGGRVEIKVSDKNVGVAAYEGFDYPTGALHNQKGGFGFAGPWINSRGSDDGYLVKGKTAGKNASLSYPEIPSTGGRFVKGQGHTKCSRELDRDLLKKQKMLEPGGEMWFSFFFSTRTGRSMYFSAGEGASFGVEIRDKHADSGVLATINPQTEGGFDRNQWSRSAGLRFPEGPNMVVGRCIWGKTDEEPDTLEVYRVFNAPGYDIVVPKKPVSVVKGTIPQENIEAFVLSIGGHGEAPMDELRVGPTRHSVMVGTKPLKE